MSWNPFKKSGGTASEPQTADNGEQDTDRTDPLVVTGGIEERVLGFHDGERVALDTVEVWNDGGMASRFMRARVVDPVLANALKQVWLELPEELTWFEDLLDSADGILTAKLRLPELIELPGYPKVVNEGRSVYRLVHLISGYRNLARLLARIHALTGLVWTTPDRARIGLQCPPAAASGLADLRMQFLDWDGLVPGDEDLAAASLGLELISNLDKAEQNLGDSAPAFGGNLPATLKRMFSEKTITGFAALADALDAVYVYTNLFGMSDVGQRREHNEDGYLLLDLDQQSSSGARLTLAAVADGMGGHASGEVASSLTLALLRQHLLGGLLAPSSKPTDAARLQPQLEAAIPAIDRALQERAALEPELAGMGTTIVGLATLTPLSTTADEVCAADTRVFWVGDSRAYLLGPWGIAPLSHDHSHVRDLLDAGSISEEEARQHPMKNVITRCLGGSASANGTPAVHSFTPGPGELILLCSDGLSDVLTDGQIYDTVCGCQSADPNVMAQTLIDAANAGGGPDNITVVLISCGLS